MADKPAILVVEDEAAICSGLCDVLAYHGHAPTGVASGEEGLQHALGGHYALGGLSRRFCCSPHAARKMTCSKASAAVPMITSRNRSRLQSC
jgi:DNA-binding response OmpR family regulator